MLVAKKETAKQIIHIKQRSMLRELEYAIMQQQEVIKAYEEATCWKITKPLRKVLDFFKSMKI